MIGYGLGVYEFKGRNIIFVLVLIIMMVPLEVMMLPLFKLTVGLHLIDSYTGVILPFIVSPVAVFFSGNMRSDFRRICLIQREWTAAPNSAFFQNYGAAHETGIRGNDHSSIFKQLE